MQSSDFSNRINRVWSVNSASCVDAIYIEDLSDLFYLTGLTLSAGSLLIFATGSILFLDGRYLESAQQARHDKLQVVSQEKMPSYLAQFAVVGFDQDKAVFTKWQQLKELVPGQLIPLKDPLRLIRAIKDDGELKALRESSQLNWKGFLHMTSCIKAGITEKELAKEFELFCVLHGSEKLAFPPIVAFAHNSAYPHHRAGLSCLNDGDHIICDVGVVKDHYCSDMTRTLFWKKTHPLLLEVEEVIHAAYQLGISLCSVGSSVAKIDAAVKEFITEKGFGSYLAHSLGHGIGLDIHEYPRIGVCPKGEEVLLQENMVVTIEPGIYIPGVGGYRFENSVIITKQGAVSLYPEDLYHL